MSNSHVPPRPSTLSGAGSRLVVGMLGLALTCTVSCLASVAPAAASTPPTAAYSIPVDELTYSSGAGRKAWGLRKHAAWSARVVKRGFPAVSVGGYRSSSGDHGKRLAADFMVYKNDTKGDKIARFSKRHRRQLNVTYVIWYQRIWSVARAREGWRRMDDQGSPTANHKDHVHVSFRREPTDDTYQR